MLRMSTEQIAAIERLCFYGRIESFVAENCRKPKLIEWMSDRSRARALWDPVWPEAKQLSEHDGALLLVFVAVCVCESIAIDRAAWPAGSIAEHEVRIKNFISERGYFRFSDFDFPLDPGMATGQADG